MQNSLTLQTCPTSRPKSAALSSSVKLPPLGTNDEAAHQGLAQATPKMRAVAAQYMAQFNTDGADSWLALEWLQSMVDECGVNIALIGDLYLLGMEAALPQLWGRVSTNRPLIIIDTAKAEVEAIAGSFRICDATSLQVLRSMSKRGGLRQVANACSHSKVISGGQPPRPEDIGAAVENLKVSDMRGKQCDLSGSGLN